MTRKMLDLFSQTCVLRQYQILGLQVLTDQLQLDVSLYPRAQDVGIHGFYDVVHAGSLEARVNSDRNAMSTGESSTTSTVRRWSELNAHLPALYNVII